MFSFQDMHCSSKIFEASLLEPSPQPQNTSLIIFTYFFLIKCSLPLQLVSLSLKTFSSLKIIPPTKDETVLQQKFHKDSLKFAFRKEMLQEHLEHGGQSGKMERKINPLILSFPVDSFNNNCHS